MTPLQKFLTAYRSVSQTEREKGTYFRNEPKYTNLYSDVWLLSDSAKDNGEIPKDTGIDLCPLWKPMDTSARARPPWNGSWDASPLPPTKPTVSTTKATSCHPKL